MLLGQGLQGLAGADHVLEYAREVCFEPVRAALQLATLTRRHDDEAEAKRLELFQRL